MYLHFNHSSLVWICCQAQLQCDTLPLLWSVRYWYLRRVSSWHSTNLLSLSHCLPIHRCPIWPRWWVWWITSSLSWWRVLCGRYSQVSVSISWRRRRLVLSNSDDSIGRSSKPNGSVSLIVPNNLWEIKKSDCSAKTSPGRERFLIWEDYFSALIFFYSFYFSLRNSSLSLRNSFFSHCSCW